MTHIVIKENLQQRNTVSSSIMCKMFALLLTEPSMGHMNNESCYELEFKCKVADVICSSTFVSDNC